ncbi:MAG: hypothetical protein KJ718_01575 [Nanoarchaeota archaeon]|nr:hypothetical protein [Nanoarchaeota archaeon]MBU1051224.1 hypothetical protein [Nanoarchaeota archaeon]MBU1988520.1 hypothetical protein [Nanoarchaeota archaeon]
MIRKRSFGVLGVLFVVLGAVLLLNYFSGITGFAVVEGEGGEVGSILGALLLFAGIAILMARAHHNRYYGEIAARVYETLGAHDAYGHKTEQTAVIESRIAAHGHFNKRDVGNVIDGEIESGRLLLDKSGHWISITTRPEKVREIEQRYGDRIKDTVVDRLRELEGRRLPAGVR